MKSMLKQTAAVLVLGLLALGTAEKAHAGGTAAGTTVTNTATLNYTVGGVGQTSQSNSASFTVDRKINLTVSHADGAIVTINPGQATASLKFTITNTGNSKMSFKLSSVDLAASSTTPFAAPNNLSNKTTASAGAYTDLAKSSQVVASLVPDTPTTVYIIVDNLPLSLADGDILAYALKAQAVYEDGTTVITNNLLDTSNHYGATVNVYNVLADDKDAYNDDSKNDGIGADRDAFKVLAPVLSITKNATTISDPVNLTTNPKNIPGATVEYLVTVQNAGSIAANGVTITDSLPTASVTYVNAWTSPDNATWTAVPAGSYVAPTLTVIFGTINGSGGKMYLKYDVTIN